MNRGIEIEDSLLTATEDHAGKIESPLRRDHLKFFWYLTLATVVVLGGRAAYLSLIKGDYYKDVARGNRVRALVTKAPRGKIYDRFGSVLVNNVPSVDIIAIPADLPKEDGEIDGVVMRLSAVLKSDIQSVEKLIKNVDHRTLNPILIKENITQDEALLFMEKSRDLPGLKLDKAAIRDYADSSIFSHIIGYEGKIEKSEYEENPGYLLTDYIGKQGLEKQYEKYLRGVHGALQVEVDSLGNVKKEIGTIRPKPGSDLFLNIDSRLQKKIHDILVDAMHKTSATAAAAVAIDPQNGGVLALVSLPEFDNNMFAKGISSEEYGKLTRDPRKPLFNRAIGGEYAPGSTLKPLVAAAALQEKTITESTRVESRGGINVGGSTFGDWKAHGFTDVRQAIAVSSNVFFYALGGGYGGIQGLGMEKMKQYENAFGLGNQLGIDLPGEASGFIPDEAWKLEAQGERWYAGNSYHAAIGQGFIAVTPLQIANFTAAIANGGTVYAPRVVSQIRNIDGTIENNPPRAINKKIVDSSVIDIVREGMRMTVTDGTARSLNDLPVAAAGKTGTAQIGREKNTHAWFSSFAPYENPEIAMVILLESGGESTESVHVTRDILRWYFSTEGE